MVIVPRRVGGPVTAGFGSLMATEYSPPEAVNGFDVSDGVTVCTHAGRGGDRPGFGINDRRVKNCPSDHPSDRTDSWPGTHPSPRVPQCGAGLPAIRPLWIDTPAERDNK